MEEGSSMAILKLSNWAEKPKRRIATTIVAAFVGLVVGWVKPNFSEATDQVPAQAETPTTVQQAHPPQVVDTKAKYTVENPFTDADAKKAFRWTKEMDDFCKDFSLLKNYQAVDASGKETTEDNKVRDDVWAYIIKTDKEKEQYDSSSQMAGAIRDYIEKHNIFKFSSDKERETLVEKLWHQLKKNGVYEPLFLNDRERVDRKQGVENSIREHLDRNQFSSDTVYEAAVTKLWNLFSAKWQSISDKNIPKLIAKQQSIIKPLEAGEWPVPGMISLYNPKNNTNYLRKVIDKEGHISKSIGMPYAEYKVKAQYAVLRGMMKELNARAKNTQKPILVLMLKYPAMTFMELENGIFRNITQHKDIQALENRIVDAHSDLRDVCKRSGKPRSFVLVNSSDAIVHEVAADGKFIPVDNPYQNGAWMDNIKKAIKSLDMENGNYSR